MKTIIPVLFVLSVANLLAQSPKLVVPAGHTGEITSVAISPDGNYILTGSSDNTAKLWDKSGHEIQTFSGHEFVVSAVAFSPDGKSVLTGSYDGMAKLWDLSGGSPSVFKGHKNYVTSVAFSHDGKSILTGSYDGTAKLWDIKSGRERQTFSADGRVWSVAFDPDDKLVLVGDDSGTAQCWNLSGGRQQVFKHSSGVRAAAFSPNGKLVLTGCLDGTAKLWNMAGSLEQTINHEGEIHTVAFSPDNQQILIGYFNDGIVKIQSIDGKKTLEYKGHSFGVNAAVFSQDSQYVLTGSLDRTARLWNLSGETIQVFGYHTAGINTIACSGRHLLIGNKEGAVKISDLSGFSLHSYAASLKEISSVALSADGKIFLTASHDGLVKLFDSTGQEKKVFSGHKGWVNSVAIAPNGEYALSGSFDKTAILWNISNNTKIILQHNDEVNVVRFSPQGNTLLTCSDDGEAILWTLTGTKVQTIPVGSRIRAADFAPDGKSVVVGLYNGLVQQWDLSGQSIQTFGTPGAQVYSVAFSPDRQTLLVGYENKTAVLWNVADGTSKYTFAGHSAEVTSVDYLLNGKFALTGSRDGTVRFWDLATGQEKMVLIPIDKDDWVAMNPAGLFDASPSAMKIMYYIDGADVIELEQLKEHYFEPHLPLKVLGYATGGIRRIDDLTNLARYPLITAATINGDRLNVKLEERNGGLGRIALLLNDDIELDTNANPEYQTEFTVDLRRFARFFVGDTINRLALRAYNGEGWLKGHHYYVDYQPSGVSNKGLGDDEELLLTGDDADLESIKLYALIVGTAKYRGEQLNLKYPEEDAKAFAEALQAAGAKLFGSNMEIKLLTTASEPWPRKSEIAAAMRDIASKADPNDVLLLYFSGHGVTYPPNSEKGRFHYLTTDILGDKLDDPTVLSTQAISQDTLQEWIRQITARKRILILDACNSGRVVETFVPGAKTLNSDQRRALETMNDRSGMFVLAGSAADKSSFEASRFGHGLLTYSLLYNMPLVAQENKSRIEVGDLFNYALNQVPLLAKDIDRVQQPELIGAGSWSIGIIDGEPPYPVPQKVPVFIRTNFMDLDKNRDLQKLSNAMNNTLDQMASQPKARLAFWNVEAFAGDHYYIGGKYHVAGTAIKGDATLYRKYEPLTTFDFSGTTDNLDALTKNIFSNVTAYFRQQPQN